MGKRRAVVVHEAPRKKARASPGAQPDRHCARDEPVPVRVHKRMRSSSGGVLESTVHEGPGREPPRKHTADRDRISGGVSAPARARTKVPLAENEDGELCEYNSFQFWRDPLPELDLTLLDDPSAPGSPQRDIPEAMET